MKKKASSYYNVRKKPVHRKMSAGNVMLRTWPFCFYFAYFFFLKVFLYYFIFYMCGGLLVKITTKTTMKNLLNFYMFLGT